MVGLAISILYESRPVTALHMYWPICYGWSEIWRACWLFLQRLVPRPTSLVWFPWQYMQSPGLCPCSLLSAIPLAAECRSPRVSKQLTRGGCPSIKVSRQGSLVRSKWSPISSGDLHALHQVFLVECKLESSGWPILSVDLPAVAILHLHHQFPSQP